ncbi:hypothetical protein CPB85DRAFT_1540000 [Mucidula mucida]|nr:hypothetical protein CPB85DRAFT_1540000 [Mucidula mucida]
MDSAQLGTPRARARVRQFRFIQLEAWHVPAIIGLLPVLMHVALGVFFSGLIIHIRSLSTPAASVVGLIVFFALLAYVGTNLFPVYDPSCPYKTPLSAYAYIVFYRTRNFCCFILPTALTAWGRVSVSFVKTP